MKKIKLSILILFLFGNLEAQPRFINLNYKSKADTPLSTIDDPALLKQAQGTWVFDEEFRNPWYKVVINGNYITTYYGYPEKGRWNDESDGRNEIGHLKIINCYKITTNGRYSWDGKPYSLSFSVIETDYDNNKIGPSFRIKEGKLLQYGRTEFWGSGIISSNNGKIITDPNITLRKVPSNYSPWD